MSAIRSSSLQRCPTSFASASRCTGIVSGEDRRLDATHPFAPADAFVQFSEVFIEQRVLFAFFGTAYR